MGLAEKVFDTLAQRRAGRVALPIVDRVGRSVDLHGRYGITVGEPLLGNPLLHYVQLPTGWTAKRVPDLDDGVLGAAVADEHRRPRLVALRAPDDSRPPILAHVHLTDYTRSVALDGAPLVLDEWAPAEALIRRARFLRAQADYLGNTFCPCDRGELCIVRAAMDKRIASYTAFIERVQAAAEQQGGGR